MKFLVISVVLGLALAGPSLKTEEQRPVVSKELIDYINSQQSSWVASDKWLNGMTVAEAKKLTGTQIRERVWPVKDYSGVKVDIPTHFDSREKWPNCIHPILNQGQCGSCWAFGATEALSDRLCIGSNGSINVVLSPQWLVSCDWAGMGCSGGWPDLAWDYMKLSGVATLDCVPYEAKDGTCPSKCHDGSKIQKYYADSVDLLFGPENIQKAILEGGPVETTFTVYEDFMSYSGGIYKHTSGKELGGHAVKIVGWGRENSTNYWIIANSWGTSWGLEGFFKIAFGQCGIDYQAVAGKPYLK